MNELDGPREHTGEARLSALVGETFLETDGLERLAELVATPGSLVWIDLRSPSPERLSSVSETLQLHPLVAEDVREGKQRAKVELTDENIHVVLFVLGHIDEAVSSEVDFVVGNGFLLTVHDDAWDPWRTHHLREGVAPILRKGPDHLLWALADGIVDDYFPLVDRIGDVVDDLQDDVIRRAAPETLERVFVLKRDLITIRRAVVPVRDIFNELTNRDLALIDEEEYVYFRDIYDHLIRLTEEIDAQRELVAGTLEVYLSTVNNELSAIMKRLTGVTLVVAGIGAIAGLFGMSEAASVFGLQGETGFWVVVLGTVAIAAALVVWLRRIDWI